jgi:hypothetical protein
MDVRRFISFILLGTFCIFVPDASAIAIRTHFIGGAAPSNAVGKGNLTDIVNAAAHIWESAYSDPFTLRLSYGWASLGHAGSHTAIKRDPLNREVSGVILFDNSGSVAFYLDPTPNSNEEYQRLSEQSQKLGSGSVNVAHIFENPCREALGRIDLLSTVLHEIGHALGLSASNPSFMSQSSNGVINIAGIFPFTGTVIPLAHNNYGVLPHFNTTEILYGSLMSGINGDERRMPSELDILVNAQISGFTIRSLNSQQALQVNHKK